MQECGFLKNSNSAESKADSFGRGSKRRAKQNVNIIQTIQSPNCSLPHWCLIATGSERCLSVFLATHLDCQSSLFVSLFVLSKVIKGYIVDFTVLWISPYVLGFSQQTSKLSKVRIVQDSVALSIIPQRSPKECTRSPDVATRFQTHDLMNAKLRLRIGTSKMMLPSPLYR